MEATQTNALGGFSYPLRTPVQAAITRGTGGFSSVLGECGRDSLHATVDHPARFLDDGVQVADPRYRTQSQIARIHVESYHQQ